MEQLDSRVRKSPDLRMKREASDGSEEEGEKERAIGSVLRVLEGGLESLKREKQKERCEVVKVEDERVNARPILWTESMLFR